MEMETEKTEEKEPIHVASVDGNRGKTLHSEADLSEHDEVVEEHLEEEHVDYSNFTEASAGFCGQRAFQGKRTSVVSIIF